jgi:glycosyltransferase involved in cell wall biosynthesis
MTEATQEQPMTTAVIPAYNEEKTIGRIVEETSKYVNQVVVVDDGSTDGTREVARSAGAMILGHSHNAGYGASLATGFKYVKNNGAGILVVLDGDGQHDPGQIPQLIAPIIEGKADVVIGSRFMDDEHKSEMPAYRRFGIGVVNKAWRFASSDSMTDTQCGFRAYSRRAIDGIDIREAGMSASLEVLDQASDNNLKVVEVPVSVRYGDNTSTMEPGKHGMELINYIMKKLKEEHPLLIFGGAGMVLTVVGLGFGILALNSYFESRYLPFGPTMIAAVTIYIGTLMIFGGLILNAIQSVAAKLEDRRPRK